MREIDHKYKQIIYSMEPGFAQTVYSMLLEHIGKEKSIIGRDLARQLMRRYPGEKNVSRKMRLAISELRKNSYLICSAPGETGGYWLPKNRKEFDDFLRDEFEQKIIDMSVTKNILQTAADKQLGQTYQESIFNA